MGLEPDQNSTEFNTTTSANREISYTGRTQNAKNTSSLTNLFPPTPLFHPRSLFVNPKDPIQEENIRLPQSNTTTAIVNLFLFIIV